MAKKDQDQAAAEEAPPLPKWEADLKAQDFTGVEVGMKVASIDRAAGEIGFQPDGHDGPPIIAKMASFDEACLAGPNDEIVGINEKDKVLTVVRTGGPRPHPRWRPAEVRT